MSASPIRASAARLIRRIRTPRGVVAVVVAAGLVGVAVVNAPAPRTEPVADLPAQDAAAWTMPLDAAAGVSMDAIGVAEDIRLRPCLAEQGIADEAPALDPAVLLAPESLADGRLIAPPLDAARAAASGYGPIVDPARAAHREWRIAHNDDRALGRALDVCLPGVRAGVWAHAGTNQGIQMRALELRADARERAVRDPAVVTAAGAWRDCLVDSSADALRDRGRPLPADPMALLGPTGGDRPTDGDAPSEGPSLARADAACQASSGYRAALYEAQWREEALVTGADAALLSSERARQVVATTAAVRETLLADRG
ncbi:hypothetical protein ABID70_001391 [Clavibacter michiganensis]|uniref:hypothetical protein n=1 Tax=Clavibacter michiganensis TaxID=28447 RepID=UPI001AE55BFD|nr:hypothetical protein [Clavibacter michiganensis]MBP2458831.1 hypothetical protein [Clavibacter michiganensis]MDQ0411403.1 hypothetical protein [Clavibacter michiganensis]